MSKRRPIHGKLLAASGAIHVAFGFLPMVFGPQWVAFARAGFFNVIPHPDAGQVILDYPSEAAFWFALTGFVLMMLGDLVDHVERTLGALPRRFVIALTVTVVVSCFMMPMSGLPILLPQVALLWWRRRFSRIDATLAESPAR